MKLGLFSDAHYSSAEVTCDRRQNNRSLEKMKEAYRIFEEAGCDLVVCLGVLTDTEDTYEKDGKTYSNSVYLCVSGLFIKYDPMF
jgi:predicted phosphodiesterase